MQPLVITSALQAYAVMAIVLSLNMLVLWAYSGAARGKSKTTPNTEDAKGGRAVVETEPPEVARSLHRGPPRTLVRLPRREAAVALDLLRARGAGDAGAHWADREGRLFRGMSCCARPC